MTLLRRPFKGRFVTQPHKRSHRSEIKWKHVASVGVAPTSKPRENELLREVNPNLHDSMYINFVERRFEIDVNQSTGSDR
jgi:hypothetical protein